MRKGMTATEVIVALALGLIIIVGLGYLVWTWIIRGGGEANIQYCKTKAFTYCSGAKIIDPKRSFFDLNKECNGIYPSVDIPNLNAGDSDTCKEILTIKPE